MVLKLDVPSLYLKINKVDNLWFDGLWTLGGITILFVSLMCGHQKCFFFLIGSWLLKSNHVGVNIPKCATCLYIFLIIYLICEKNLLTKKINYPDIKGMKILPLWVGIPIMTECTRYNIMWYNLSVTCDRSVVFSGFSVFLHQ